MDGSGAVEFPEFCVMMVKKMQEADTENEVNFFNKKFGRLRKVLADNLTILCA